MHGCEFRVNPVGLMGECEDWWGDEVGRLLQGQNGGAVICPARFHPAKPRSLAAASSGRVARSSTGSSSTGVGSKVATRFT